MSPSRLRLVDGTLALLSAALEGRNALEALLGVAVAEDWEGFPEALPILRASYEGNPDGHKWGSLFFIELEVPTLVGFGGFKGSPSPDGVVEIGYAVAPAFRGQGLATDAVAQMVQRGPSVRPRSVAPVERLRSARRSRRGACGGPGTIWPRSGAD